MSFDFALTNSVNAARGSGALIRPGMYSSRILLTRRKA
jgi:hypothetical protein